MEQEAKQQFNVYLPPPLVRRVKYASIDAGLSLSRLVEQALAEWLARQDERTGESR
ncbi:MAG TPA: ribbon-helix-helix protein, CopG family [Actinocatenispora sp.]